ncbi:MAG: hypothetical protein FWC83_00760 [Alphaproteobacteria bacterium]|nr:hypothetical protein [Alphaproteobacteria bacterium]
MTRTFIYALPDAQTLQNIKSLCTAIGVPVPTNLHCTILYSKTIVPVKNIIIPGGYAGPFNPHDKEFQIMETHDDGRCVLLRFESGRMQKLRAHLKSEYNLDTTHGVYRPHITLARNYFGLRPQSHFLKHIQSHFVFDKIVMDNGKQQ